MRIVGGRLKGRGLQTPRTQGIRPTSDKVRESIFNVLMHSNEAPSIEGAKIIDLFAGTGALGLEAVSRGASYALFVEENASARAVIRENIEALGLQGVTRIFRRDATRLGPAGARDQYALVFLDPPYGKGLAERALAALSDGGWLTPNAVIVLEEAAGAAIDWPGDFDPFDHRTYGDTAVHFARWAGPSATGKGREA